MRIILSPLLVSVLSTASIAFGSGCPERAPAPIPRLDLTRPSAAPSPRVVLAPAELNTQADFDALEDRYLERRAPQTLMTALTMLADAAMASDAELSDKDALLLQRLAILHLALAETDEGQDQTAERHTQKALDLAMALSDKAPRSPHSLFLQGYVPFSQVGGSDRRDAFIDPSDVSRQPFRDAITTRWTMLLEAHPDYQGPRSFTAARIRRAVDLVKAASTSAVAAAPTANKEAVPARTATRDEALAIAELARLERSPDGLRTTACRDWMAGQKGREVSPATDRVTLFCLTAQGKPVEALPLIERLLASDGEAFDPCLALGRLGDRVPADALGKALAGSTLLERCR